MRMSREVPRYLVLITTCFLQACAVTPESEDSPAGTYVVIEPTGTMEIEVGDVDTVAADVMGLVSGVTCSSSQPAVATVNATTGVVQAVALGTATITATATVNPALQSSVQVAVVAPGASSSQLSAFINEVCP